MTGSEDITLCATLPLQHNSFEHPAKMYCSKIRQEMPKHPPLLRFTYLLTLVLLLYNLKAMLFYACTFWDYIFA